MMIEIVCEKCGSERFIFLTNSRHSGSVNEILCENCETPLNVDENWAVISRDSEENSQKC